MKITDSPASIFLKIAMILFLAVNTQAQDIPRPEYPEPQFERSKWINLNGAWDFTMQTKVDNPEENWKVTPLKFENKIIVPFTPECKLSGIGYTDFIMGVWYKRTFNIPDDWQGQRIFIRFGGVDFDSRVWINNQLVGRNVGGDVPFEYEITKAVHSTENVIVVYAYDNVLSTSQPLGKQSDEHIPWGIKYTRTTGIWQTVWLEARPQQYIKRIFVIPNLDQGAFSVIPEFSEAANGDKFEVTVTSQEGKKLTSVSAYAANGFPLLVKIPKAHPWSPQDPYLYNFEFVLKTKTALTDSVKSYAGLRKFHIEGNKFYLNNKPVFLRMVLDQGFYPDGAWTAPTDGDLKNDIILSMAAGFNSARLHQKVFEPRFHYWADKLGYLTWAEFPDWGGFRDFKDREGLLNQEHEWRQAILRDRNHPSIVAWTPFNETGKAASTDIQFYRLMVKNFYELTRALDPTRPVNTTSGYVNVVTDIFTVHDYDQNPVTFKERYSGLDPENPEKAYLEHPGMAVPYDGQPFVVDEYEGTYWLPGYTNGKFPEGEKRIPRIPRVIIGYGKTADEIIGIIKSLTDVLLNNPNISGFTYCQFTDVENEVNGVYYYDRKPKFDIKTIHDIISAPAAIENPEGPNK
jgi:beta-galactosidase/beta-glucuronidase